MNLWWKLTIEWPAALGDWLWKVLIKWPAESLKSVTFRGVLVTLLVILLLQAFVPIELAFFAAGDLLTWMEIVTIVGLMAGRGHFRQARIILEKRVREALARISVLRQVSRRWQSPISRAWRERQARKQHSSNDDAEPPVWGVSAYA